MFRRPRVLVAMVGAAALLVVGTGGVASAQGEGEIFVSGSSTVEPLTSLVAELFAEKDPDVSVRVDGPGTGDGFQLFCNDETDVSDASRPIEEEEAAACEANGVTYTELPVAVDGLTVIVNPSSKIKCLSQADLYAIFGPESGSGTTDLSTANTLAQELNPDSPNLPSGEVTKYTPGPESGTYDSFIELGYEDILGERLEAGNVPADKVGTNPDGEPEVTEPQLSAATFPNDNETVKRIESQKNGIGYLGYAYFKENKEGLKSVAIQSPETGKCVKPTDKTIVDGTYDVLSRTLYIYPNNAKTESNANLKSFLDFYMTKNTLTTTVEQSGYIPLHSDQITESIDAYKSALD